MTPDQITHLQFAVLATATVVCVVMFLFSYCLHRSARFDGIRPVVTMSLMLAAYFAGFIVANRAAPTSMVWLDKIQLIYAIGFAGMAGHFSGKGLAIRRHPEVFGFSHPAK